MKVASEDSTLEQAADVVTNDAAPVVQTSAAGVTTSGQVIETWFSDLLQSVPVLRETEVYNKVRTAVTDLKTRIS